MPLIPVVAVEVCTVEIDGDWYRIRKLLSVEQFSQAHVLMTKLAMTLAGSRRTDDIESVAAQLATAQEAVYRLLELFIVDWSHDDDLTPGNIRRIPQPHVGAIKAAIGEVYGNNLPETENGDPKSYPSSKPLSVNTSPDAE